MSVQAEPTTTSGPQADPLLAAAYGLSPWQAAVSRGAGPCGVSCCCFGGVLGRWGCELCRVESQAHGQHGRHPSTHVRPYTTASPWSLPSSGLLQFDKMT